MKALYMCLLLVAVCLWPALGVPADCRQAIVVAVSWVCSHVKFSLLEYGPHGWKLVSGPFPARLGKSGLVWGRGLTTAPKGGKMKKEGDMRSPAGIFELGGAYGTVPTPKKKSTLPYRRITPRDMWVDDPKSPLYNRHYVLDHDPATPWELKQRMKLNDYAHSLKLFIKHNAAGKTTKPVPGGGSSIFFHIWRWGGQAASAGCTTMSDENLRALIAWLDPAKRPVYILLPRSEYMRLRGPWRLP